MSGSSSVAAMKKVVQQLRLEAGLNRVKSFPGSCRFETILSAECSTRSPADWSIFKYKSLQTPESLFLFVVKRIFGFLNHFS
ncbi:putative guanine nucleotide-binding protein G(I)/G(S)/G(O) subunit gamma-14 [Prionailurus iriomotensis]